ncbi:hypothetical protein PIB30_028660 [Stylosanthes scabra]|uniref:Uncharacterized protein n=1 Tax=Stylosanthes scabra TaxID=79078 RepID=A0ABU6RBB4_9FABA|nr:hypothetical protein [Stylosanthes scabra]
MDTESDDEVTARKRAIAKGSTRKGARSIGANNSASNGAGPKAHNNEASSEDDGFTEMPNQCLTSGEGVKFYQPLIHSSDEDYVYDYESETLHTPVSSEEEYEKHSWQEFRNRYAFGEGHFEIGYKFATLEDFKDVVNDLFIAEGRDPKQIKVKTYINNHICARGLGSHVADQNWLSRKIEKRLIIHPHMSKKEVQAFLKEDFNVTPHEKMVYRALRLA